MADTFDRLNQKLAFRLMRYSVLTALAISLVLGCLQILNDFKHQESQIDDTIRKVLNASYPPASRAVHTLDKALAKEVVSGLMQYSFIESAAIIDELNNVLAEEKVLTPANTNTRWLTALFSEQQKNYLLALDSNQYGNAAEPGRLLLNVNLDQAYQPFFTRALEIFVIGVVRNILLAGGLIMLFYYAITQPLAVLAHQFSALNPRDAGDQRLFVNPKQQDTELGQLASAGNIYIDVVQGLLAEKEQDHRALLASEERLNNLIDHVPQLIAALGKKGDILFCNESFAGFYGKTARELIGCPFMPLFESLENGAELLTAHEQVVDKRRSIRVSEFLAICAQGNECYLSAQFSPFEYADELSTLYVASDITPYKEAQNNIIHMANHDALTGLPNRALLYERLENSLLACQRRNAFNAVLFIDLDHFKVINDSLGHDVGDLLLQKVADILTENVRADDTVARLGGDEFVVLLQTLQSNTDALIQDVKTVCDKIINTLSKPIDIQSHPLRIGASIGVVIFPTMNESLEDLMRFSDTAMYHAKENGRNCYAFYNAAMSLLVEQQQDRKSELDSALERNMFRVHYQPIVDRQGNIQGFEALLRLQHPERGLVVAADFINDLENSGTIIPVGEWLLSQAAEQIVYWKNSAYWQQGWYVAVNQCSRQFYHRDNIALLYQVLSSHDLEPGELCFEVTEAVMSESLEFAIERVNKLHDMGVKIALDDFGSGYSSLRHLQDIPIDIVKIDRSFIKELNSLNQNSPVAEAVCSIAQAYSLTVIAEGVETQEQIQCAAVLGCHFYQGFIIAPAQPAQALKKHYHNCCESEVTPPSIG